MKYVSCLLVLVCGLCVFGGVVLADSVHPRLGGGDVISIKARGHRVLTGVFVLDEKGRVRFPIAGQIQIRGLTIGQARRVLVTRLSVHYRRLQGLQIRLMQRKKYVWVRGWVKKPGRYHVLWSDGVEVALQQAGGFRKGATTKEVWYYQKGKAPQRINMLAYYLSRGQMKLPFLGRGGMLFVVVHPSQLSRLVGMSPSIQNKAPFVAVFGAVRRPGLYPCTESIHPLQVLAMAGGPLRQSGVQEALLFQKGKTRWFDLRKWLKQGRKARLPKMTPGSILYIPHQALGLSGRPSVQWLGAVRNPGIVHAPVSRTLTQMLARRGGTRADADLSSVVVTTKGSNFTIKQTVNVMRAIERGRLELLPPVHTRPTLVFVPPKPSANQALNDAQNITQIVVAASTIVTSVVLIIVTANAASSNNP